MLFLERSIEENVDFPELSMKENVDFQELSLEENCAYSQLAEAEIDVYLRKILILFLRYMSYICAEI